MQYDYIMRMIEQFVHALASIIRSRKAGMYDQAIQQIQKTSHQFLNTDIESIIHLTPNQLIDHFTNDQQCFDADGAIMCADLLEELAQIFEKKEILNYSLRLNILSLNLYLKSIPTVKEFQTNEYKTKTSVLIEKLSEQNLPEDVAQNLDLYRKYFSSLSHNS